MRMMAATAVDKKRVVIVGATGYIGKFVVKEAIRRGWKLVLTVMTSPIIFHKKFELKVLKAINFSQSFIH